MSLAADIPRAYDAGRLGRLTWLGLVIAAIGWALLIASAALSARLAERLGAATHGTLHDDSIEIARCLIGSGFGLAVVGALQNGFGALNRFFAAVLSRSSGRPPAPAASPIVETMPEAETLAPASAPSFDREAEALRERRPFHVMADGSVEVEMNVGTRRFATMAEARDFI